MTRKFTEKPTCSQSISKLVSLMIRGLDKSLTAVFCFIYSSLQVHAASSVRVAM